MPSKNIKVVLILTSLFGASGCCGGLKASLHDQAISIHKTAAPTVPLIDACKGGNAGACDAARANVDAIDKAALQMELDAK
jgi:hypothetical protein